MRRSVVSRTRLGTIGESKAIAILAAVCEPVRAELRLIQDEPYSLLRVQLADRVPSLLVRGAAGFYD